DEAVEVDYLNKSMPREGYPIKYIILHGTAGGTSAEEIANYFANSDAQASAHIVIGTNGEIVQGIPLSLAAWGNGPISGAPANLGFRTAGDGVHRDPWWDPNINPNFLTVSIEHCKPHDDNSDEITPAQQDASFKLVKAICDTYGVPKRFADASGGLTGHFSMDPVSRSRCPGPYPWDALFAFLGGNSMNIPQGWADDGTTLTAPNGHKVVAGFRGWILTQSWDAQNVPLEEEHTVSLVEEYYPSSPGARQLFNYGELGWTQARGVFPVGIGNELLGCRKERDSLKSQIAALQALPSVANLLQINALASQIVQKSKV